MLFVVIVGGILFLALRSCDGGTEQDPTPPTAETTDAPSDGGKVTEYTDFEPVPLEDGVNVVSFGEYDGLYQGDGTDEMLNKVPVVTVENTGEKTVQYMEFTLTTEEGTVYEFELPPLAPGEKASIIEKNRTTLDEEIRIISGEVNTKTDFDAVALGNGIQVISIGNYAGRFVEDGSDEMVNGIPVVTVENTGRDAVQLMNFTFTTQSGTRYEFGLTTLFPGEKMAVLEKNRTAFDMTEKVVSWSVDDYAVFREMPTLCTDRFLLVCADNTIRVKNISDQAVSSGRVMYKNESNGMLFGGITYMASFPELAPGAEVVLNSAHFVNGESRIVFVTYAE